MTSPWRSTGRSASSLVASLNETGRFNAVWTSLAVRTPSSRLPHAIASPSPSPSSPSLSSPSPSSPSPSSPSPSSPSSPSPSSPSPSSPTQSPSSQRSPSPHSSLASHSGAGVHPTAATTASM